jgi:hypothetical protein
MVKKRQSLGQGLLAQGHKALLNMVSWSVARSGPSPVKKSRQRVSARRQGYYNETIYITTKMSREYNKRLWIRILSYDIQHKNGGYY